MDLNKTDIRLLKERYKELYSEKTKNFSIWEEIARYCRIEKNFTNQETEGKNLDMGLNDPSSFLAINSSANNLYGILIGNGDFFNLTVSEELKEKEGVDLNKINQYLKTISKRVLRQINKPESNFKNCMLEHLKDQQTFGTSGIGTFINDDFLKNKSNSLFEFMTFGVDNTTIDEGKSGIIDTIFINYKWRINKIIKTFCFKDNKFDKELFDKLPERMKKSYEKKPNDTYELQLAIIHNDFFKKGVEGKIGCKYLGVWYLFDDDKNTILATEYYKEKPINIVRADKIRGELYGRADGTKILSFIKMLNYCMADAVEVVDKMVHPAIAVVEGSLTGDKIIDTSPNSATVVKLPANSSQSPIFNLQDIGDPSGLLNILIPSLKESINTAFKTDLLLDNNNVQAKTATEMIQRYNIRSKLLYSVVYQQVNDLLIPMINYCIKIMLEFEMLGKRQEDYNSFFEDDEITIPEEIIDFIKKGKDWYKIEFNTEISKMSKSQELEDISQLLQMTSFLAQMNPDILKAVNWYDILSRIEYLLNNGESYLISKYEYENILNNIAEMQNQMTQAQGMLANSEINKNNATALKANSEAQNNF